MVFVKKDSGKTLLSTDLNTAVHTQRYSSICKALRTSLLPIDNKQIMSEALLASLTSQLFNHYQEHYGKASPKPRPITIPSSHLFFDFEAEGSLFVMLSTLLVGGTVRDLVPLDKIFDNSPVQILPILHDIDKNLSLYGFSSNPRIFLNTVPVGQIQSLSKIVVEHGGELVSSEEQATHIVDWNDDFDSNEASSCLVYEENARAIDFKVLNENGDGLYYLIHWPFLPDSANEWVLESSLANMSLIEQQAAVQGRRSNKKPRYNVACRFLMDVDTFNEWGNESDYEAGAIATLMAALAAITATATNAQTDAADMVEDPMASSSATATPAATSSARKPAKGGRGRRASNAGSAANTTNTISSNNSNTASGSGATQQTTRGAKDLPLPPLATALYEKFFADILPETLTRSIFLGAVDTARVLEIDFNGAKLSSATAPPATTAASSTVTIVTAVVPNSSNNNTNTTTNNIATISNIANNNTSIAKDSSTVTADAPPSSSYSSSSSSSKKRKLDEFSAADRPVALWLSLDRVSDFERRVLSYVIQEHLPQGVTSYLQMRNAIIQLYLQKPSQCLTATECRRKIAGDVARLTRIHEFLDAFGAINSQVTSEARPDLKVNGILQRDMSLSHRRQHLVDRLLHHYPSCVSTVPKPSSLLSKTQTETQTVTQSSMAQHATHRWTKDMDDHLLTVVRLKSMDWAAISHDMTHWLDHVYLSRFVSCEDKKENFDKKEDKDTGVVVKQEEEVSSSAMDEDETPAGLTAAATTTSTEREVDEAKYHLSRLSVTQRHELVTPLLCMLRFMELQMSIVVRSPAAVVAGTPSNTTSNTAGTTVEVPVKTEKDVSTSSSATAENTADNTTFNTTSSSSNINTANNSDRAASLFIHPALLVQHSALLSTATSEVGIVTQKEQWLVSRVAQAVTHLVALDHLLDHDIDTTSTTTSTMDVDPHEVETAARSLATQLVSQLTQQVKQYLQHLQDKQNTLLQSSLEARLAMLDAKLSLVEEVEEVLHLEREELAHEKRDFYLQRLLHVTTPLGVTLNLPNTLNQPINNNNNTIFNTTFPGSASAANMTSLLPTSASSTALATMMM